MGKKPDDILGRVSTLADGDSSRDIYDEWSGSYDDHLLDEFGYISPEVAASALAAESDSRDLAVMDYGCGTGLVGEALGRLGFSRIDGIDVSAGMLARARAKGVYRNLVCVDLTHRIALDDAVYDAATCIGSMGAGDVGAQQPPELLRPLSPGAPFVIIMNATYYLDGGFERAFRQLEKEGLWRIRRLEEFNYMSELNRPGWLLVAAKQPES